MGPSRSPLAKASRERLIESHLPLVRAIARRYGGRGEEHDDLFQVGAVGLVKASDRFDPNRGVAFAAFAAPAIEGEIRRHLRDRARPLRIPRGLERMSAELRRCHGELAAALGRSPTGQELASALGVDERDVERALSAEHARDSISISAPGEDSVELPADSGALAGSDDRLLLARGVRVLDDRERRIVFLRFNADMTERQIARVLGISQAHVSRLLGGALAKLRQELASSSDTAAQGDTTPVIPPSEGSARSLRAGDRSGTDAPELGVATPRMPGVGGSHEKPTLAQYLELPYHVEVRSEQQDERSWWKATVEELPGCASGANTPDEAVARLRPAMESWLTAALAEHREIPVPGPETPTSRTAHSHSGRFLVRMPKSLHEQLARAAEREQVSLNRFVTDMLADSVAPSEPAQPPARSQPPAVENDPVPSAEHARARAFRVALATNLVVVVVAGLIALVLLALALQRGI